MEEKQDFLRAVLQDQILQEPLTKLFKTSLVAMSARHVIPTYEIYEDRERDFTIEGHFFNSIKSIETLKQKNISPSNLIKATMPPSNSPEANGAFD
jgi:hypothetical protein